jgi:hypothetical protein
MFQLQVISGSKGRFVQSIAQPLVSLYLGWDFRDALTSHNGPIELVSFLALLTAKRVCP